MRFKVKGNGVVGLPCRNRKRKLKNTRTKPVNCRLPELFQNPAWNNCINNNTYSLSREELIRRREQRISKNLATAQAELYGKMKSDVCKSKERTRTRSLSPGRGRDREPIIRNEFTDFRRLIYRSEELINESKQLLGTTCPEPSQYPSRTLLTKAETNLSKNVGLDRVVGLDYLGSIEKVSYERDELPDDPEVFLSNMLVSLRVKEDNPYANGPEVEYRHGSMPNVLCPSNRGDCALFYGEMCTEDFTGAHEVSTENLNFALGYYH